MLLHKIFNEISVAFWDGLQIVEKIPLLGKPLSLFMSGFWMWFVADLAYAEDTTISVGESADLGTVIKKAVGLAILLISATALIVGLGFLFSGFASLKKGEQGGYGGSPWMKIVAGAGLMGLTPLGYALFKYFWEGQSLQISLPTNPEDIVTN